MFYENHPKNVKALCIIIHGMGEHAKRYVPFLNECENNMVKAVAFDLPFHGEIKEAGIFEKINDKDYLLKVNEMIAPIQKKYKEVPQTLMGHSMGSLIARRYAEIYPNDFTQMIWMGTMPLYSTLFSSFMKNFATFLSLFKAKKSRHYLLAGLMNQSLNKNMPKGSSKFFWLSYNPENVTTYEKDPCSGYAYNGRFYTFFFHLLTQTNAKKEIEKTTLKKVYLISGEDDPVTSGKNTLEELVKIYQKEGVKTTFEFELIPNMRHEILHEEKATLVMSKLMQRILS